MLHRNVVVDRNGRHFAGDAAPPSPGSPGRVLHVLVNLFPVTTEPKMTLQQYDGV